MLPLLAILTFLPTVTLAAPSSFSLTLTPLLALSSPSPFLGLDDPDAFTNPAIGHVGFLPGLHPCGGRLEVWSVEPALQAEDWDLLKEAAGGGEDGDLWELYEKAPTKALETEAVEGVILAWVEGWKKTCGGKRLSNGRGRAPGEVRVSKVFVDGADKRADREGWVRELDAHLRPLISSLPPSFSNSSTPQTTIFLTSLSPPTLLRLFELASTPPSTAPSAPSSPSPDALPPQRQKSHHSLLSRLFSCVMNLLLLSLLALLAVKAWERFRSSRFSRRFSGGGGGGGGIALPTGLTPQEEREFQFELEEGASDEEDGEEGAEELPHVVDLPVVKQGERR